MCSFYVPAVGTCHLPRSGGCRNDLITGPFCWRFFCGNEARMGEIQKWWRAFTAWNLFSQTSLLEIFWDDWFTWWSFCPCIPLRERRERGYRAAAQQADSILCHRRRAGCHLASDSHPIENQLRMEPQLECFFPLQRADWLARTCTVQCSILFWDYTYVSVTGSPCVWRLFVGGMSTVTEEWRKHTQEAH